MTDESSLSFNALVIGWYGAPNVGDEVLLEVLRTAVASKGGGIIVASVDPVLTREMHGVDCVDFHNLGEIARALLWADVLIMGGGGIFQDHHPFHLHAVYDPVINDISSYVRPILMARQFSVPVLIWGHGVGPLAGPDARVLVRDIFNGVTAASVRDDKSLKLLREIGVDRPIAVGADPGWLYRKSCIQQVDLPSRLPGGRNTLAIVVREWFDDGSDWKDKLLAAIDKVVDGDWQVKWIAFQANIRASSATSDVQLLDELREGLPSHLKGELLLPRTPKEAWDMLVSADAIFSMRLHASILGLLAKKPLVGLEYDDKMAHAHDMASLPHGQRLRLSDSVDRYVEGLRIVMGKSGSSWVPDDTLIARLEESACVHLTMLDHLPRSGVRKGDWTGGQFDWLATWLQQTITDLRETKERSRSAHELLRYRDSMVSERDAKIESMSAKLAATLDQHQMAVQQSAGFESKFEELERRATDLEGRLAASQSALAMETKRGEARQERLMLQESEMQGKDERVAELSEQLRILELEWREARDDVEKKDAYIADKEVYIAQLIVRVSELDDQVVRMEAELCQSQDKRPYVRRLVAGAWRHSVRLLKMPLKFFGLWRKYGFRVALHQTVRRLSAVGRDIEQGGDTGFQSSVAVVPLPVRDERLLAICHAFTVHGSPSRAAALVTAATRAGFFARWYSPAPDVEHYKAPPALGLLRTDETGLLDQVRPGTRVLLADLSPSSLKLAEEAKARGADVILDLSSVDIDALAEYLRKSLVSLVSRAVSHEGTAEPRLPGVRVDSLPNAADNEEFDSYKNYPYPDGFRKRRRNILVFAEGSLAHDRLVGFLSAHPHDQVHMIGSVETGNSRIRPVAWHPSARAALLAAADVLIVSMDASAVTEEVCEAVRSALIMERPVVSEISLGMEDSKNFHLLDGRTLGEVVDIAISLEDYDFVSTNTWLGRAEQLMQASFPSSVSVVVLIHNNQKIIRRCISTILAHCGNWIHEIVVVDNQSSDGGAEFVERLYADHPKVKLVRNTENGCSSGRNLGVSTSTGEYIVFFDSDQWLTAPSCFAEAIHILQNNPNVGTIGWNAGWFDAGRDDLGGAISDYVPNRGMNTTALSRGYREDIGFLGTSGMFIKRALFDKIEGFDTFYDPTCFEDTDICFQIKKAGYAVAFRDLAGIRHQPHQTTGASEGSERYRKLFNRNADYFRKKWEAYPSFFVDYVP